MERSREGVEVDNLPASRIFVNELDEESGSERSGFVIVDLIEKLLGGIESWF